MTNDTGSKTLGHGLDPSEEPPARNRSASPKERKPRQNLTIRIRTELREKLEERARLNGRSLSEETEMALELLFVEQGRQDELWASDIKRHFEKDIEELFEQRSSRLISSLHDKNMNEMRKLFFLVMERMSDMQKIFSQEKAIYDTIKADRPTEG